MKKLLGIILSAVLFFGSTVPLAVNVHAVSSFFADKIMLQSGRDISELNFNWIVYERPDAVLVQIAEAAYYYGGIFPEGKAQTFVGSAQKAPFGVTQGEKNKFVYDCEATAEELKADTEYVYRVGDGESWSACYTYSTPSPEQFKVLVFSDIHIYDQYHPAEDAGKNWQGNLTRITETWPEASHVLSLGDQMQNSDDLEFIDNLFAPEELRSLSFSAINGNHDVWPNQNYQKYYYNFPNIAKQGDAAYTGYGIEDYYYLYGNILFVMLNYENTLLQEQKSLGHWEYTLDNATREYAGQYDWIVACVHQTFYGDVSSVTDNTQAAADLNATTEGAYLRLKSLSDALEKHDVDMVLFGHQHKYTRSYFLKDGQIVKDNTDETGAYVDQEGFISVGCSTTNTLSGEENELYGRNERVGLMPWLREELTRTWVSTYLVLESQGDSLTVTSYEVSDPLHVFDSFTLKKSLLQADPSDPSAGENDGAQQGGEKEEDAASSQGGCSGSALAAGTAAFGVAIVCIAAAAAMTKRKGFKGKRQ